MAVSRRVTNSHGHEPPSQAAQIALLMRYALIVHSTSKSKAALAVGARDTQSGGHGWAGAHSELQGVTIDFWGGPQLHLWPQAARPL